MQTCLHHYIHIKTYPRLGETGRRLGDTPALTSRKKFEIDVHLCEFSSPPVKPPFKKVMSIMDISILCSVQGKYGNKRRKVDNVKTKTHKYSLIITGKIRIYRKQLEE